MIETASPLVACELHKRHSPANLTVELHHVTPVGWQLTWRPPVAPYPGNDPNGRGPLWDSRTVAICPTGHRNTHAWIVKLMHALAGGEDPQVAFKAAAGSTGGVQARWALEALVRFKQYGGTLAQLVAAHEWGQI